MAEFKESEPWLEVITSELKARDLRETIPFEDISFSYISLLAENVDLSSRTSSLSQALMQLKQDNWKSNIEHTINEHNEQQSPHNHNQNHNKNYEVDTLQKETITLRKELMDVYRLKRENEEALSRLKKQSIEHEELIMQRGQSLNELSYKHKNLVDDKQIIEEENYKLKGGLQMLTTESIELRKAHDNAMKELDRYKDENRRLTEQLLKVKENQMDQLQEWQSEFEKYHRLNKIQPKSDANSNDNSPQFIPQRDTSFERRHTINTINTTNNTNKTQTRNRWSIGGIINTITGKDEEKGNNANNMLTNIFGTSIQDQDRKQKKNGTKSFKTKSHNFNSDFANIQRAPIVDLYGPSLFNVVPPQLKSKKWQAHSEDVCSLQFDGSGKKLISSGSDKLVKIWDSGSGQELGVLRGCQSSIICSRFSTNHAFVCAAGNDCQLHLWNVKTQRQIRVFNGHTNKITSLAFTADSRFIYSGSHDRTIRLWDLESAACKFTMSAHSSVNDLAISPDEYYLATAHMDGCIRFWGKRERKELFKLEDHKPQQTNGVQFSPPDGIQVLTSSKDGKIIIWDLRKQQKLNEINDINYKNTNITGKPCYSPDGQYILGGASITDVKFKDKYSLFIWKTKTAKLEHTLSEHTSPINAVVWHGRGGVVSSDRSGHIVMWC